MNPTTIELNIPAEIVSLPLTLAEKAVLAQIHKFPGCTNNRLAKLIGGTCRGVENLLRRLRRQGFIAQSGKGRARRHRLLFPVEQHTLCGDNEIIASAVESHTSCGDQPGGTPSVEPQSNVPVLRRVLSLGEDLKQTLALVEELCQQRGTPPETILYCYEKILKRLMAEAPEGQAKDTLISELTVRRDAFFAVSKACRLPRKFHRQLDRLIASATPEKLADFKQRVEAGQLEDAAPLLLASCLSDQAAR